MKNPIFILISLFFFASCQNTATEEKTDNSAEIIQNAMEKNATEMLLDPRISSISIGIYRNGETYTGHYGELDKGKGNTPTDETLYEIASVTKTMTGTLIAQAVVEGKLSLDDDIRKYLPQEYPNLVYDNKPIQIKHLLTHTSRLPGNIPGVDELYDSKAEDAYLEAHKLKENYNKDQFFKDLGNVILDTFPGIKYEYSNVAAELTSFIAETAFKKPYEDLLNEYIFDRANMSSTKVRLNTENFAKLANGYNDKGLLMPNFPKGLWGGAGRVKSSTSDLLKYAQFHLDKSNLAAQESHRKLHERSTNNSIGYFWVLNQNEESNSFQHHGGAYGMQNWFLVYPEYDMAISVITNVSFSRTGGILWQTSQGLLDDLKPFGKKSIGRAIKQQCYTNIEEGLLTYHQLKSENPEAYNFSNESELNNLGYQLMGDDKLEDAIKIFELLVAEFPEAFNPYDSLGEAYFNNKEYSLSLENYKKSLALNPKNSNAEVMIKKIEKLE